MIKIICRLGFLLKTQFEIVFEHNFQTKCCLTSILQNGRLHLDKVKSVQPRISNI